MNTALDSPEVRALTTSVNETVATIGQFTVVSNDDFTEAGGLLIDITRRRKQVDEERKKITVPMDAAKKAVMDFFRPVENQLALAETRLRMQMSGYRVQQQIAADAEAARLRDIAEKQRAKDLAAADRLAARGKTEQADAKRFEAETSVAPVVVADMPVAAGISTRENWHAEIYDLAALVVAVAEGKAPQTLVVADQRAADQLAKALKGAMKYPGVRPVRSESVVARG